MKVVKYHEDDSLSCISDLLEAQLVINWKLKHELFSNIDTDNGGGFLFGGGGKGNPLWENLGDVPFHGKLGGSPPSVKKLRMQ